MNSAAKELKKSIEKKKPLQRKTLLLISVLAVAITVLTRLHEFNESWAWEIANALITVNGFVIGFTIVGVALFSERAFTRGRMVDIFTEHMDDLKKSWEGIFKEAMVADPAIREKFEKNIRSMLLSAMLDIYILPRSMIWAVGSFLFSIGCAFSLFGVSDTTANNPLLREVFGVVLYLSIYGLILGIFFTYKGLENIITRISSRDIIQAISKAGETFAKDSETATVDKRKKATKQTEK